MAEPKPRRATYADVLAAPEHVVAEIIAGELRVSPRPAGPHTVVTSTLGDELGPPFRRGRGGPGGWILLDEPELHLAEDILVPDLAGWRRSRMPAVERKDFFTLAPDWVCEVLSPDGEKTDRAQKLPIYAQHGVQHAWLIHPLRRTLEVLRLHEGMWLTVKTYRDDDRARAEPFDAIELELAVLWADIAPPPAGRASEAAAAYEL